MTLLGGLEKQVQVYLKGSQVLRKEKILETIKRHNLVFANEIEMDGEHLIFTFDDYIICFELVWKEDGPFKTLIDVHLA